MTRKQRMARLKKLLDRADVQLRTYWLIEESIKARLEPKSTEDLAFDLAHMIDCRMQTVRRLMNDISHFMCLTALNGKFEDDLKRVLREQAA